jgi:hypothetical protein
MPQDKRLVVTRIVVDKIKRDCDGDPDKASRQGVYVEFIVPTIILQNEVELSSTFFNVAHAVYPRSGRATVLIVPKAVALDCAKINRRHSYYDAVVVAETICRRGDPECEERAAGIAKTFDHFVVDSRIVSKLPPSIQTVCRASAAAAIGGARLRRKFITPISGFDDPSQLTFACAKAHRGGVLRVEKHGTCLFRVGHGGMTAGEITENAKNFIFALKKDHPHIWRYIADFLLVSPLTEPIRFMEANIK